MDRRTITTTPYTSPGEPPAEPVTRELLFGHTSQDTALVCDDYPYGFRLRCKIRYWIETDVRHGDRFVSQTTNPKVAGERWNKPKPSTYTEVMAMVRGDDGHISRVSVGTWPDLEWVQRFEAAVGDNLNPAQRVRLSVCRKAAEHDAKRKAERAESLTDHELAQ